jgi:dipeptidyl aminopeptidase/acylaminoacyl peptidase
MRRILMRRIGTTVVCVAACALTATGAAVREPLPAEVAASVEFVAGYDLSPDGRWIATQMRDAHTRRNRVRLEEIATGKIVELGTPTADTGGAVWSPDSRRLAYNSNQDGEPSLWIWERDTATSRRIAGAFVPAANGGRTQWFSDSTRLVTALWPEGALRPREDAAAKAESANRPPFAPAAPDARSVFVLRANLPESETSRTPSASGAREGSADSAPATSPLTTSSMTPAAGANTDNVPCMPQLIHGRCDLGLIQVDDGRVTRVATKIHLAWFADPSPDGRFIAYTEYMGVDPASQDQLYDLVLADIASGRSRRLATGLRPYGGLSLSWSPDSTRLAYISYRPPDPAHPVSDRLERGEGDLGIVAIADGATRMLTPDRETSIDVKQHPIWDAQGATIYALTPAGEVWACPIATGAGKVIGAIAYREITTIVKRSNRYVLVPSTPPGSLLVMTAARDGSAGGLATIDPRTGTSRTLIERPWRLAGGLSQDASATGQLTFRASDQQHPESIWMYDLASGQTRSIGHVNAALDRYALGEARVIAWQTADGEALRGTLLLPPDYQPGRRLPLVVWVYGGNMGSDAVTRFGLTGTPEFNLHMLATRGYAVLAPDVPLRLGQPLADMTRAVMPGVDAAIAQGYADPDRLAVMGHSFGSYSTLALITQTTRFKAAVISGVMDPDLVAGYLRMASGGGALASVYENGQIRMGGTPWEYPDRYRENSPIYRFDKIATPLLIGQGEIDFTTPMRGADAVFVALRRLGKPVEYRVYEGEGHGFARAAHVLDFWHRRLAFLADHLDLAVDEQGAVIFDRDRARAAHHTGA